MKFRHIFLTTLLGLLTNIANAHLPAGYRKSAKINTVQSRTVCASSTSQIDQEINNVRARLLGGGDMWWDFSKGSYIVPKANIVNGEKEVSAIFAAGVWMGGVDGGGNLKLACQDYRPSDRTDFWPGPLNRQTGTTDQQTCLDWDKHFRVTGDEIRLHLRQLDEGTADPNNIPAGVKGWPARGNPFFTEVHQFSLPNTGLASFFDADGDANYNPLNGDFPTIEVYGCPPDRYPDEMIFWIYNDEGAGAVHSRTGGKPMLMEVQVQAFGYKTDDELNDMTFQRYKLINRGTDVLDSTFFAIWVDVDLGCHSDDYVGCDPANGLMYAYNQDAVDGQPGYSCDNDVATYGDDVPMIGVDFFRGARNAVSFYDWSTGQLRDTLLELGMTRFIYYNGASGFPPVSDPSTPPEFYNYLTGSWRDGSPLTKGGSGFNFGSTDFTNFALSDSPNDPNGWSMCTAGLDFGDRRTIQSSGPFRLNPGAINELIIGVPFVSDVPYPCPDIEYLLRVDKKAQALFEECFGPVIGPQAPLVEWVELNHQVVAVLSNEYTFSNNFQEKYEVRDFFAPDSIKRSQDAGVRRTANYRFEGYKIYQLVNPGIAQTDFDNPDSARLVYQVDKKNGIGKIFNWESTVDPNQPDDPTKKIYYPVEKVDGADEGIRHTFSITEDLFAEGNVRTLINHKKYYYTVVAYAYNNFGDFEQQGVHLAGQQRPYLEGIRIQTYTVIPRPIVDQALNSSYGDSPEITRIEGAGAGGNFLEISTEQRDAMLSPGFNGEVSYQAGKGPLNVIIYNPFEVVDGDFEIAFYDSNNNDNVLDKDAKWVLRVKDIDGIYQDINQPFVSIDELNEQLFTYFNFSITIAQTPETGNLTRSKMDASVPSPGTSNGAIGAKTDFGNRDSWFLGIADQESGPFNFVQTGKAEKYNAADPEQKLSSMGDGSFVPYPLVTGALSSGTGAGAGRLVTPGWTGILNGSTYNDAAMGLLNFNDGANFDLLNKLPNVDIVFTPDKSKWSRCVVLETASEYFTGNLPGVVKDPALKTESGPGYTRESFDTRFGFSVGKDDNNGDGLPDPDGAVEPDSIPNPSSTDPQRMMENPLKGQPMRGMGWFPGYAVNVETGERLNIFFGENSCYNTTVNQSFTGGDMLWNPTSQGIRPDVGSGEITDFLLGGHHWVYVSNTPYDECNFIRSRLNPDYWTLASLKKVRKSAAVQNIAWAGMLMLQPGQQMDALNNGLVPSKTVVSLRVQNPYQVKVNTGNGHPRYRFRLAGKAAQPLDVVQVQHALDSVKVVPNPYYAASAYPVSEGSQLVKITNLPPKCTVTIYNLAGQFVRQFKRNESYSRYSQVSPALEWDVTSHTGAVVPSGVYLIHVDAYDQGERVLKWFGVAGRN